MSVKLGVRSDSEGRSQLYDIATGEDVQGVRTIDTHSGIDRAHRVPMTAQIELFVYGPDGNIVVG